MNENAPVHADATDPVSSTGHVVLLGATGTIGQAAFKALLKAGWRVTCLGRRPPAQGLMADPAVPGDGSAASTSATPVTRRAFVACNFESEQAVHKALQGLPPVDAIVSCMASRTGVAADAWAIDHQAHLNVLMAARQAGIGQFVLLSAICVQRPRLAFQQAKLAFEAALIDSGLNYSIVRPTAFFKSLTGQIDRVRAGKPYLVFGNGMLTACKPISDEDLAAYLVGCLSDPARHRRILPIGGPGPAITPLDQARHLFKELGQPLRVRSVPLGLLDTIIVLLATLGRVFPALAAKAELARIGRYYASESMLVWNDHQKCYDAQATPETGTDTLYDFQSRLLRGEVRVDRGDHAVF